MTITDFLIFFLEHNPKIANETIGDMGGIDALILQYQKAVEQAKQELKFLEKQLKEQKESIKNAEKVINYLQTKKENELYN